MASINYDYEPERDNEYNEDVKVYDNNYQNENEGNDVCYSTELEELDKIELTLQNAQHTDYILKDNNINPDPTTDMYQRVFDPKKSLPTPNIGTVNGMVNERKDGIQELTNKENEENLESFEKTKLSNTSINDFIRKISNSYLDIINELLEINSIDEIPEIFIKDDRLISIGILFLFLSIIFILFNQS